MAEEYNFCGEYTNKNSLHDCANEKGDNNFTENIQNNKENNVNNTEEPFLVEDCFLDNSRNVSNKKIETKQIGRWLDGRYAAKILRQNILEDIQKISEKGYRKPGLAIILIGSDPASCVYVRNKTRACDKAGIISYDHSLPEDVSFECVINKIDALNNDPLIDGILVQLPLPRHLKEYEFAILQKISPKKDVDGFNLENIGLLHLNRPRFVPCTPQGILTLLDFYGINVSGKHAIVIGRSLIVGKPMAALLTHKNATVTLCHSCTQNLPDLLKLADIVVAAVGIPHLIQAEWLKDSAVVVDVGINRINGCIVGDVNPLGLIEKGIWATPVPGGVGPMTIAQLLKNCLNSYYMSMFASIPV